MVSGGYSVGEVQSAAAAVQGGLSSGRDSGAADGPFFYVRGAGQLGEEHE